MASSVVHSGQWLWCYWSIVFVVAPFVCEEFEFIPCFVIIFGF